jgi:hypothetical protein
VWKCLAHSLELFTLFAIASPVLLGAGSEVLGFSKEVGAFLVGLVLIGTIARTGISGLIIGNTAAAVFNQRRGSILALNPPGFESPVKSKENSNV